MPSEKISQLTSGNPAQSGDLVPIARSGANYSLTAGSIAALAIPGNALPNGTTATTQSALSADTKLATDAYCDSAVAVETSRAEAAEALKAPLASPALTGTPTAPTPSTADSSTTLATTSFVHGLLGGFALPSGGLIGEYRFLEGSGYTTADSSGNGNNATLGNQMTITNLSLTTNVVTITTSNNLIAGETVYLTGLTTTPSLNGTSLVVLAGSLSTSQFTANLTHANITSGAETGFVVARTPTWAGAQGGLTFLGGRTLTDANASTVAGGQCVSLPTGINAAKTMLFFVGKQLRAGMNVPSYPTYGGLCVGNSGSSSTSCGLVLGDNEWTTYASNAELAAPCFLGNVALSSTSATPAPFGNYVLAYTLGVSPTTDAFYVNGVAARMPLAGYGFNSGMTGNYQIGGSKTFISSYSCWFSGTVYYAVFYNSILTAAQVAQASSYMNTVMLNRGLQPVGLGSSSAGNVILSDGDSIQQYNGGWFPYNAVDTNQIGTFSHVAISVSGDNAVEMMQRSWAADAYLPPSAPYPSNATPGGLGICEFMIGTNELTATPSSAQSDNQVTATYAKARRNAGWSRILQCTVMDAGIAANKNNFNWFIRKNYKTYADGLIDCGADPALGADGANSASSDNYYFANGVHPSAAGQARIGAIKSRVINHLIGNTLESGSPNVAGTTATINNTALTTNVATYSTTTNHHFSVNETIAVSGLSNNSGVYNVTQKVTSVPTPNTFTFAITHANIASGGDSGTASKGSSYTMLDTDTYLEVSHAISSQSIYLPSSLGYTGGCVWVKNQKSGDSNTVTLYPYATATTLVYAVASTSMDGSNNLTVTGNHNYNVGDVIALSGFTTQTFCNGQNVTITSVTGSAPQTAYVATGITHAAYSTTAEAAAIGTKTLAAETIDGGSSLVIANGATARLRSVLISPETGGNNWETVSNS